MRRLTQWIVVLASTLAPRHLRREMCEEWDAELSQLAHRGASGTRLLGFALGAFPAAFAERSPPGTGGVVRELRFAFRALRSRPGYVTVATLTLAVGVTGAAVVFSVVDRVALTPLPYTDARRLVALYERSLADPEIDRWPVAPANYFDWRSMESLSELAAYRLRSPVLANGVETRRIRAVLATGNAFELLGTAPAYGRGLLPEDAEAGEEVAVLSHGFAERAFSREGDAVGRQIVLDGVSTTVVGVMGEGFRFPYDRAVDVWIPLTLSPEARADRARGSIFPFGRLAPGVTIEEARREARRLAGNLAADHPETNGDRGINVVTVRRDWLEWRLPTLAVFTVVALATLAIACLNLAGLMLSRSLSRRGELAVRMALGAGVGEIAWSLLAEGLLVGGLGGGLGALAADRLLPVLSAVAPAQWAGPLLGDASVDGRVLGFVLLVTLGSVLAASLVPILRVRRMDVTSDLRSLRGTTDGPGRLRLRRWLVFAQTVLAVVLLAEAGMLARSFYNTLTYEVGLDSENVLTARIFPDPDIGDPSVFYRRLDEALEGLPGVEAVSFANIVPLSGDGYPVAVTTDGSAPTVGLDADAYNREVEFRVVDGDFFRTLGIETLRGRTFGSHEDGDGSRPAVVNQAFVETLLADRDDPLGAEVRTAPLFGGAEEGDGGSLRVVGVVSDVAEWGVWMQPPIVYVPAAGASRPTAMSVMIRTSVPPGTLADPLRRVVRGLGSRWPVEQVFTLEEHRRRLYRMNDFLRTLLGVFAGAAVLLSTMGLYGVVALQVGLRRRELSIRRALGARGRELLAGVVRDGLVLSVSAVAVAAAIAVAAGPWIASSWMGNFLFDVEGFDPVSFATAALLLVVVATASAIVPGRRASRVDPALALREET